MTNPTGDKPLAPALADFIHLNEEIAALVRARIPLESHLARIGRRAAGESRRTFSTNRPAFGGRRDSRAGHRNRMRFDAGHLSSNTSGRY